MFFLFILFFISLILCGRKPLTDYNQANEKCLLHISSTCWRDAVGVTKPQSSNRPVGLLGLLSLDDFLPRVRTLATHMGDSRILLSCVPAWSGKRKKVIWDALLPSAVGGGFSKWSSCREGWLPPTTCSPKPPLYCGWKKLNVFSQALKLVLHPLPLNNILYFCILPDIFDLEYICWHLMGSSRFLAYDPGSILLFLLNFFHLKEF